MSNLFKRLNGSIPTPARTLSLPPTSQQPQRPKDRNLPDPRLQVKRQCIYERRLPGGAYVAAHVERLQYGFYDSPAVSDPALEHLRFLAITFVFHPSDNGGHRFKGANIRVSLQNDVSASVSSSHYDSACRNPKFLMYAPHLMYGAVSPETLQWNFNLAGSLGISQAPIMASLSPSGAVQGSYRFYEMMKIQGSSRTFHSPYGPEFDVEDGEVVWSLKENVLQKSGLPREFTFVMLLQKPRADNDISLNVHIDPIIAVWYGSFPSWWLKLERYLPIQKKPVDLDEECGQRFEPTKDEKGFNFADLQGAFEEYVSMPGSTFSTNVSPEGVVKEDPTSHDHYHHQFTTSPTSTTQMNTGRLLSNLSSDAKKYTDHLRQNSSSEPSSLNVRLIFDRALSPVSSPRRHSSLRETSPTPQTTRQRSLRRSKSRDRLNTTSGTPGQDNITPMPLKSRNRYSLPTA